MNTLQTDLLARLEAFEIGKGDAALTFARRLARENAWPIAYAQRVVREYKRFVFLAMQAGHPLTPSEDVDQAWHLHMTYTRSYWDDMCGGILGKRLNHDPTLGGKSEDSKFRDWYTATLESYRRLIGSEPDPQVWPHVDGRFRHAGEQRWVNPASHWIVSKRAAARGAMLVGAAASLFALAGCGVMLAAGDGTLAVIVVIGAVVVAGGLLAVAVKAAKRRASGQSNASGGSGCGFAGAGLFGGGCGSSHHGKGGHGEDGAGCGSSGSDGDGGGGGGGGGGDGGGGGCGGGGGGCGGGGCGGS